MKHGTPIIEIIKSTWKSEETEYVKISFPTVMQEDCNILTFLQPVEALVFDGEEGYADVSFGLKDCSYPIDITIPVKLDNNFLLMGMDNATMAERVYRTLCFDLFHAFFHHKGDPNYGLLHWALYGNFKEYVTCTEDKSYWEPENY